MNKLITGICLALSLTANAGIDSDQTIWHPQWSFDPMTDKVSCSAFSSEIFFRGKVTPNHAYIGIQDNGTVTVHTRKDAFDPRYVEKFGIRPGKQPAIMNPESITSTAAKFSDIQSKQIIEGIFKEGAFTLQVAFFLDNEPVQRTLKTGIDFESFNNALASKNSCNLIKDSQGWVGIGMQDMVEEPIFMSFLKQRGYEKPGIMLWSVHPKKIAAQAGIQTFDIILEANSKQVDMKSMLDIFTQSKPGEVTDLTILRGNNIEKFKLVKP